MIVMCGGRKPTSHAAEPGKGLGLIKATDTPDAGCTVGTAAPCAADSWLEYGKQDVENRRELLAGDVVEFKVRKTDLQDVHS